MLSRIIGVPALLLAIGLSPCIAVQKLAPDSTIQVIPVGGNGWIMNPVRGAPELSDSGLLHWTEPDAVCRVMFRVNEPCRLTLSLSLSLPAGSSTIRVDASGKTFEVKCSAGSSEEFPVGELEVDHEGYVAVDLRGVSRTDSTYGRLDGLVVRGPQASLISCVPNNEGNFYYWGRRGPSVHLNYAPPADTNVEWFYTEVTIPRSQDVVGSFFMADGFTGGYFGMQVNSETERRILFSVWSPFVTDNPAAIPADQKVELVKKGAGVHAGEFGDEGSGGQSYMLYDWKAGSTYGFLLHAEPGPGDHTRYTAYFYPPEESRWMLVASFRRPKTSSYLKRLHSFLENFIPETGIIERSGLFGNQWAKGPASGWSELTEARFSADNTARKGYRMDYAGGTRGSSFVLRNCGFFNDVVPIGKVFRREPVGKEPAIDLLRLP